MKPEVKIGHSRKKAGINMRDVLALSNALRAAAPNRFHMGPGDGPFMEINDDKFPDHALFLNKSGLVYDSNDNTPIGSFSEDGLHALVRKIVNWKPNKVHKTASIDLDNPPHALLEAAFLARDWHGGQWSALYKLQCGQWEHITRDDLHDAVREFKSCKYPECDEAASEVEKIIPQWPVRSDEDIEDDRLSKLANQIVTPNELSMPKLKNFQKTKEAFEKEANRIITGFGYDDDMWVKEVVLDNDDYKLLQSGELAGVYVDCRMFVPLPNSAVDGK